MVPIMTITRRVLTLALCCLMTLYVRLVTDKSLATPNDVSLQNQRSVPIRLSLDDDDRGDTDRMSLQHMKYVSGVKNNRIYREKLKQLVEELFPVQFNTPFAVYQLNVTASNALPVDRSVTDFRSGECRRLALSRTEKRLPDATIIVPFYEESWSMLLRTVHGIMSRSPSSLVRELILVDDCSTHEYLGRPLER